MIQLCEISRLFFSVFTTVDEETGQRRSSGEIFSIIILYSTLKTNLNTPMYDNASYILSNTFINMTGKASFRWTTEISVEIAPGWR